MVLRLPDAWTWDFWLADTGEEYHLFFLRASRALHDPHRRHRRASIGHARSTDLHHWTLLPDALVPGDPPAFDDLATWTGSVVQAPGGTWHMFYTGVSRSDDGLVQRIGVATSDDLITWHKRPESPILTADQRWYERLDANGWFDEAWRDPWVFPDPGGDGWHMLITARADAGPAYERGVIGHARSADLMHWHTQPPLSSPGAGFGQLEVLQATTVDGRGVVLFSCLSSELSAQRRSTGATGGIWAASCDSVLDGVDVSRAQLLTDERFYAGRLVRDRAGRAVLLAFHNADDRGGFLGELSDPMPVTWAPDGQLTLDKRQIADPTAFAGATATGMTTTDP